MRVFIHQHCVYRHLIDGRIFYIGRGSPSRPFACETSKHRTPAWRALVEAAGGFYDVEIVGWYESDDDAAIVELAEIRAHDPIGNSNFTTRGRSPEIRESMRLKINGKNITEQSKLRMSASKKGMEPWNKGRKMSAEERTEHLVNKAVREKVSGREFPSIREASRETGVPRTDIHRHIAGKMVYAKGCIFERIADITPVSVH